MLDVITTIGMLVGGLGLFLLAVGMITDGLKVAAGHSLRDLLAKWTRSPAHGIAAGIAITALVQSSSAVTVATIGFVNAGLINMFHALGVVFGANIGTTITGWIVAIIGFEFKINAFALPLIGIGMLLRLSGGESRRASIGTALAGFGLFFIGIDALKNAFEGMAVTIDLNKFTAEGISGLLLYLGIGFLMTVLTQSSSAAIAITLTAATGGILGLHAAAAMVIGANVGTTSTAVLAAIGATSNAKRVATAHVIFNLGTGIAAFLMLPLLFWAIQVTEELFGLEDIPAVTLALFHTFFNVLGVLLMWPLTGRLARFLETRFVTQEESEARPQYLDKNIVDNPMFAIHALSLELTRVTRVTRRMALGALSTESSPGKLIETDHQIVQSLSDAIADFINRLEQQKLTGDASDQLSKLLRAEQHLLACASQALSAARAQSRLHTIKDTRLSQGISNFRSEVVKLMDMATPDLEDFSIADCENQLAQAQTAYDNIKTELLRLGTELGIPAHTIIEFIDQNSRIRRMARQMYKAMRNLHEVILLAEVNTSEVETIEQKTEAEEGLAPPSEKLE